MNLELNENEKAVLSAMASNVIDSNIGTECLTGWGSTRGLTLEEIEIAFQTLNEKIKNLK